MQLNHCFLKIMFLFDHKFVSPIPNSKYSQSYFSMTLLVVTRMKSDHMTCCEIQSVCRLRSVIRCKSLIESVITHLRVSTLLEGGWWWWNHFGSMWLPDMPEGREADINILGILLISLLVISPSRAMAVTGGNTPLCIIWKSLNSEVECCW